jgi:hypothetical protein
MSKNAKKELPKWIHSYIIQIIYLKSYVLQSLKKNALYYKFTTLLIDNELRK